MDGVVSTRSAQGEVVLARLTIVDGRPQLSSQWISVAQGNSAHWRRDGAELVYMTQDGQVMAVPTTSTDGSVRLGKPTVLFKLPASATTRSFELGPAPGSHALCYRRLTKRDVPDGAGADELGVAAGRRQVRPAVPGPDTATGGWPRHHDKCLTPTTRHRWQILRHARPVIDAASAIGGKAIG
jgi:hypothetical protein